MEQRGKSETDMSGLEEGDGKMTGKDGKFPNTPRIAKKVANVKTNLAKTGSSI